MFAYLCARLGRSEPAGLELEQIVSGGRLSKLPPDGTSVTALVLLAEVCVHLRDQQRAAVLYRLLRPHRGHVAVLGAGLTSYGPISYRLARLACALEHWDQAERHFAEANVIATRMGASAHRAQIKEDLASALATRAGAGHVRRAKVMLAEAVAIAEPLGMLRVVRRARSLLERLAPNDGPSRPRVGAEESGPRGHEEGQQVFRREGQYWTIAYEGAVLRLKHTKGLAHLSQLLRHPDEDLHALFLVALAEGFLPDAASAASRAEAGLNASRLGNGELVDAQARANYRSRVADLREQIAEAEANHDLGRLENARAELDQLFEQLAGAFGHRGSGRAGTVSERARLNVTRAIKSSIGRIQEHHPALARHLFRKIRTGTFCSYVGDGPGMSRWQF
jgi:non-specific serine/threonine protein kinase